MFLFASGGAVGYTRSIEMHYGRVFVSDRPVRSFQSRTPSWYQEGTLLAATLSLQYLRGLI